MLTVLRLIALRHVRLKPGRSLLTALGVTLGVALYVAIALVNRATLHAFEESVESLSGTAALTVLGGRTGFPSAMADEVRKVEGVSHAVGMVEMTAYFRAKDGTAKTLSILGIDLLNEASVRSYKAANQDIIDDPLVFLNQPDSIIVTTTFARDNHLAQGDAIALDTAYGIKPFTIRGVLSPEGPAKAYGGTLAIMDIDAAQLSFGRDDTIDRVDVIVRKGASVEDVRRRLVAALGPGYRIEDPTAQTGGLRNMVASFQGLLSGVSALALLVAIFLVGNTVAVAVASRRREIGTLRALGTAQRAIVAIFVAEAAVVGVVGAAAGVALGRVLATLMTASVSMTMTTQFSTAIHIADPRLGAREAGLGILVGTAAAVGAALLPALSATRVHPLEALKRAEPDAPPRRRGIRSMRALGVVLLAFVLASSRFALSARWPAFEVLDALAAISGAILATPWLVDVVLRGLRPLARWAPVRRYGVVLRLACDNLLATPKRTGSNVMGLMVGLMLVVVVSALGTSFKSSLVAWFDEMLNADIFVSAAGNLSSGGQVQPLHESVGKEIAEIPGVQVRRDGNVSAMRVAHVRYEGQEVGVKAWDRPDRKEDWAQFALRDGPKEGSRALYEGDSSSAARAIISENFATHFGKRRGDLIVLESPSGPQRFEVIGVVVDFANPIGIVYVTRDVYKERWRDPLVTAFMVRLLPGYKVEGVRAALDARFGASRGLFTHTLSELKRDAVATIDQAMAMFGAIEAMALGVALFGLVNTLLMSILERMREIGTYRAIGMSKAQLGGLILTESILQGALGGVAAALIGAYLSWAYLVGSLSRTIGFVLEVRFPVVAVLVASVSGVVVAAIAGWLPARRAAALAITETLADE